MTFIKFDYDTFYKYYTTDSNLKTDLNPPYTYYYPETDSKTPVYKQISDKFIKINNTKVYITQHKQNNKNQLLFSIPIKKDNTPKLWNDHYHFGINLMTDYTSSSKEQFPAVFFHKTTQRPNKGKLNENCYFSPIIDIDLDNFENIKCLQRGYKMREIYLPEDFIFIKEIISRPFLNLSQTNTKQTFLEVLTGKKLSGKGGTKKKTRRNRRKSVRRR